MPDPIVRLRNVSKQYGDFKAVNNISLDIVAGEFVTLLGPSGCGKTTTLRMIGGFEAPDAGRLDIADSTVSGAKIGNRVTRMVFQSYALFPHMTVFDNVAYGLKNEKRPKEEIKERVDEILNTIGLASKSAEYPTKLSGGQQQRVALARALVTKPLVLLLDEPLGALDLKMRKRMQHELKELQRKIGITFIYVTHDQSEALAMSDTLVVMKDGQIAQIGSPEEVYNFPRSTYVADFVGSSNIIPCVVAANEGGNVEVNFGSFCAKGRSNDECSVGDSVFAVVRPENVSIVGDEDPRKHIPGHVSDVSFEGGITRYTVRTEVGEMLVENAKKLPLEVDKKVNLAWNDADCFVVTI